MKATLNKAKRNLRKGQTLVMALIIMGVLLILGVVFIAMINQNIRGARASHERSIAYDLAESGVRYAHTQMLNAPAGADWRPTPTPLPISTFDPDYALLRMPDPADPTDHGGPDKQGPYARLIFDRGRALIRVRYAPSDPTVFSSVGAGDLLQPGMARNYTVIESIGKAQSLDLNDPTQSSLQSGTAKEVVESKKIIAFVSCGLIEHALFVDNKYHTSNPAEFGVPTEIGVDYDDTGGTPQPVRVPMVIGNTAPMFNPWNPNVSASPQASGPEPFGGSVYVNADLLIHGNVIANMNSMLGDGFFVAGTVRGADDNARLTIQLATPDYTNPANPVWATAQHNLVNNGAPEALNSDSGSFSTLGGVFKDAYPNGDSVGYPRAISYKEPPSILRADPDTGVNRYVQITQNSGKFFGTGNSGRYGFGQGVYVNNNADIQMPTDEQGRSDVGSAESLMYDWTNPNNGQAGSGWSGSFYIPRGSVLRLLSDGFQITRDSRAPAPQRAWREPDGSLSKRPGAAIGSTNAADIVDSPYIRYKIVFDPLTGQNYIFNSYSVLNGTVIDLSQVNSTSMNNFRDAGYPFNGVLYFAGNVRIRGEIPTNVQMVVVSGATIYIEGSITKGTVINNANGVPTRLTVPSRSMIGLLAKDYVAVNTSQFFGTEPGQVLEEAKEVPGAVEWNPVRLRTGGGMNFLTEFDLDPNTPAASGGNPLDPSTWKPFAMQYIQPGTNTFEISNVLLTHAMDNGPAPATFLNMNVNYSVGNPFPDGAGPWQYLFDLGASNGASSFYPAGYVPPDYTVANKAPLYGLGVQPWQLYSKFESASFPLITNDFTFNSNSLLLTGSNTSPTGLYNLFVEDQNILSLGLKATLGGTPTNDYVLARAAIVPHDIQIDATIFAEEGSFYVIPGPWFNADPNDTRSNYVALPGATQDERDRARLETFGSSPNMPFYGEPLDVKISIFGAITENMPPPISQQAESLKKWGWIPRYHGASGELIPQQHVAPGFDIRPNGANQQYVPNITITYDPALATDRSNGFVGVAGPAVDANTLIRYQGTDLDGDGRPDVFYALPPLPRLPVSPTLAYFGEVKP